MEPLLPQPVDGATRPASEPRARAARAFCVHETLKYTRLQLVIGVDLSSSTQSSSGEPATRAPARNVGAFLEPFYTDRLPGTTAIHLSPMDSSIHPHVSPPRAHPVPGRGSAGPGRSPGRFFYHLMAFSKRNLRTTRPAAPRWKAHIEICQKARQKRVSVVLGEGQEVRGVLCVQRAGERVAARMWRGHARASRPFRITGRDEMVMAARVVVRGWRW